MNMQLADEPSRIQTRDPSLLPLDIADHNPFLLTTHLLLAWILPPFLDLQQIVKHGKPTTYRLPRTLSIANRLNPSQPTNETPPQPLSIRLLYGSALAVQSFDSFAFYTISPLLFPNRSDVSHPATRFFVRQNATLLFPYILSCWFLRDYHIRHTKVGRVVGMCFALFHASALAMYSWSRWVGGEYAIEPFGVIAGAHAVWAIWAVWGLLAA
ncbi:hypothetical protein BJX68DRAFT_270889 [Aspergillus pseudodeflectus]|uniref:Uncharacterized protein n=1 Tax=Aspergillus pseudodeflectus TaxID=176178 RepID=A0ABR4JS98_9EURO